MCLNLLTLWLQQEQQQQRQHRTYASDALNMLVLFMPQTWEHQRRETGDWRLSWLAALLPICLACNTRKKGCKFISSFAYFKELDAIYICAIFCQLRFPIWDWDWGSFVGSQFSSQIPSLSRALDETLWTLALPLRVYYKFLGYACLIAIVVVVILLLLLLLLVPHVNCICIFTIVRNQRNYNAARFLPASMATHS